MRISSQSEMVSDVPPPPLDEVSMGSKAVTASKTTLAIDLIHKRKKYSLPIVSTRPVNIAAVDDRQGKYPRGVASALAPPSGVGIGVLAEIRRFPQIPFNGGYSSYLSFCFELHFWSFAALSAYINHDCRAQVPGCCPSVGLVLG